MEHPRSGRTRSGCVDIMNVDRAAFNGTMWCDIDWNKPIHAMFVCPCCGIDSSEEVGMGHQSSCYYGDGSELAGSVAFFTEEIQRALAREKEAA